MGAAILEQQEQLAYKESFPTTVVFELSGTFYGKVMFPHSLNIICSFYVIPLHLVFKLMGLSPKGRPKMRQFFEFFVNFKYRTYLLISSVHQNNYNTRFNHQY